MGRPGGLGGEVVGWGWGGVGMTWGWGWGGACIDFLSANYEWPTELLEGWGGVGRLSCARLHFR